MFPGIRSRLFSPNGREGYSDARVETDEVRTVILEHEEFEAYASRIRRVLDTWRQEHAPRLRRLTVGDLPKALIRELSEDLLRRFAGLPLLDRYSVYQCLMDYWDDVMQDDVYLVVTEGWAEAARPRVLVPVRGKGAGETADLTVKRKKYRMDLLPPRLVVGRYFAAERAEIDRLRTGEEEIAREREEFIEENSGEDGLLDGATSDTGKVTQSAVKARLKEVGDDPGASEERDALDVCLELMKAPRRREESDEGGAGEAGRESARSVRDADRCGGRRDRGRRQVDGERPGRDRQCERTGGSGQGAGRAVC